MLLLQDFLEKIKKKIPLEYACEWDNVGLLIEPFEKFPVQSIMLTNDLTETVLDEAINKKANLIISYHPPIFKPFKSITQNHWKERIIGKCLMEKIAVYSPHTALDAIQGGINDWLLKPFNCSKVKPIENVLIQSNNLKINPNEFCINLEVKQKNIIDNLINKNLPIYIKEQNGSTYLICCNKESLPLMIDLLNQEETNVHILSITNSLKLPSLNEGMGRIGNLSAVMTINQIIKTLKQNLGLNKLRLALAKDHTGDTLVNSIAVCAGSGASLLKMKKADFFITGEMSHHDLLDATHRGISIALCEHTNTERGYLKSSLYEYLVKNFDVPIMVSESDQDPVQIV